MKIRIDKRYAVVTAASLLALYWLSSVPSLAGAHHEPFLLVIENFSHAPLFAALAFAWHKTVTRGRPASALSIGLALVVAGACAALDEWHQSFVPGRDASAGDLAVDLAGICIMLIFLYSRARRSTLQLANSPTRQFR